MLGKIECKELHGICLLAYTVFDEAATRLNVDSGDKNTSNKKDDQTDNLVNVSWAVVDCHGCARIFDQCKDCHLDGIYGISVDVIVKQTS